MKFLHERDWLAYGASSSSGSFDCIHPISFVMHVLHMSRHLPSTENKMKAKAKETQQRNGYRMPLFFYLFRYININTLNGMIESRAEGKHRRHINMRKVGENQLNNNVKREKKSRAFKLAARLVTVGTASVLFSLSIFPYFFYFLSLCRLFVV